MKTRFCFRNAAKEKVALPTVCMILRAATILLLFLTVTPAFAAKPVTVGVFQFPPLAYTNERGEHKGLFIDLIREIAQRENWDLTFVPGSWGDGFEKVKTGQLDLMPCVQQRPEREVFLDYQKESVFVVWGQVLVQRSSKFENLFDLKDKKIGLMEEDANGKNFLSLVNNFQLPVKISYYAGFPEVAQAISKGEVDAGVFTNTSGHAFIDANNLKATGVVFSPADLRFATAKGKNGDLLATLDLYLSDWKQDPHSPYYNLRDKYFSTVPLHMEYFWRYVVPSLLFCVSLAIVVIIWRGALRRQVKRQTLQLREELALRTRAEEQLKESIGRYKAFFEHGPDGIVILDPNTARIIEFNDRACEQLGYSREEFALLSAPDIEALETAEQARDHIQKIMLKGYENFETRQRTKQGEFRDVQVFAEMIKLGVRVIYHCVLRDITEQKMAEESLKRSEEYLRLSVESGAVGLWEWNLATNKLDWSDRMKKIFGLPPETTGLTFEKFANYVYFEDLEKTCSRALAELNTDKELRNEYRIVWPDKSIHWIEEIGRGVRDSTGKVSRIMGTAMDITDRKRREEDVSFLLTCGLPSTGEDFFRSLARYLAETLGMEYVCIDSLHGDHLSAQTLAVYNDGAFDPDVRYTLKDTPCGDVVEKGICSFTHGVSALFPDDMALQDLRAESYVGTVLHDSQGQKIGLIAIIGQKPLANTKRAEELLQLVAPRAGAELERREAERKLRESELRFSMCMDATNDVLWDWDIPTGSVYYSPGLARILDLEQIAPTYDEWVSKIHPEDQAIVIDSLNTHLAGQTMDWRAEHRLKTRHETWKWVLGRGRVVAKDEQGRPLRMLGTISDISEMKRLNDQLGHAQKMEAIGTLAGGIAHDFNNILGAIIGYTELSADSLPQGDPVRENLQEVLVASVRAKELVQQILAFGRRGEKKPVSVDSGILVSETLKLLVSVIPKTISIDVDIDTAAGHVLADPTELHQVVMNLCTNAYQAMPEEKGVLRVRLSAENIDQMEASSIPALSPGDYVRLDVVDDGAGMTEETLSRIFEPYFTTKAVGKGTGLGLALVHGIVTSLGGAIAVRSTPGIGTSFSVYLPRTEPAITEVADSMDVSSLHGKGSVLVVDDEPALARLAAKMLQSLGYRARVVTNPLEALRVFESDPSGFDVIVTDQTMPGMTGADLVRRAKAARPGVAAVMCTGYSDIIDEAGAIKIGIAAYIQKPYDRNRLGSAVAVALRKDA